MAVESWLWSPGHGILAVESWLWKPGCGILAVASWLWNPGCGGIWETPGRHLGEPWEVLGRSRRPGRHLGGKYVQTPRDRAFCVHETSAGVTVYRACAQKLMAGHPGHTRGTFHSPPQTVRESARTPQCKHSLGNKKSRCLKLRKLLQEIVFLMAVWAETWATRLILA